ncbi:MAG: S9 family peptidase [Acidimicrobiia bacterium]|nr:S9 family peptidase [Acidimicrobiia bacterium]
MRLILVLGLTSAGAALGQLAPLDAAALMKITRISDHQLSPDGRTVAFTAQVIDVGQNTRPRQIYWVPLRGGVAAAVTIEGNNSRARWSPDGKTIAFLSTRANGSQIWLMDADGRNQRPLTNLSTEADGHMWSGDSQHLIFTSEVYPDCPDEACNKKKLDAEKADKVRARIYTGLLYRHWDSWQGTRRKHILVIPARGGAVRDLTPGTREVPPFSLGGPDDYAVSPDGKELCFVMNPDPQPAISTNSELFVVPMEGGEPRRITQNPAADSSPLYSPDGIYLAYRSQSRAGFESDRWRLVVIERSTGRMNVLTEALDRSVGTVAWAPDSKRIFYTTEDRGRSAIHMIPVTGGASRPVVSGASHADEPQFTRDGKTMIYSEQSGSRPVEIYRADSGGTPQPLTRLNDKFLSEHHLTPYEDFWVEGAERTQVHSFLVKPPAFDEKRKYPVLFLIHGGPQGAWGESWSYRWNAQVFAAAGYLVIQPNPRGSTGYGQKFTDEISGDWGGRVYEDLMAVVDHVQRLPYVDGHRMAAAGGSYGGYMVNWILGRNQRFKALVSHAGVYDLRSMGGETEELWFTSWEFGGMPWDKPDVYEKWSPSNFVKEFKTPTLVIHGELDYRVPAGQGLQLFTALQMQKVPSKLLLYPDEGHWILKPQNSLLWYKTFLDWIGEWTKPGA